MGESKRMQGSAVTRRWRFRICLLTVSCLAPVAAKAQGSGPSPLTSTPPSFQTVDSRGVDLASGNLNLSIPVISIGNDDSEIGWSFQVLGNITAANKAPTLSDNIASVDATADSGSGPVYLNLMGSTIPFTFEKYVNGSNASAGVMLKPLYKKFGKLLRYTIPVMTRTFKTKSGSSSFTSNTKYVYVDRSGSEYTFYYFPGLPNGNLADSIKFPNGNIEKYYYNYLNGDNAGHGISNVVVSVENSFGMQLKNLNHHEYTTRSGYQDSTVSTVALNKAYAYCNPELYACTAAQGWPTISIYDKYTLNSAPTSNNDRSFEYIEVSDRLSKKYAFNYSGLGATQHVKSYTAPGPVTSITKNVSYDLNSNGLYSTVASITHVDPVTGGNVSYEYDYAVASGTVSTTARDPLNRPSTVATKASSGLPATTTDKLGKTMTYAYDSLGNVQSVTRQDGSSTVYTYDDRGNVTYVVNNPATNSGLASTHTSAGFDADCVNYVKCNKPNWTRDSLENETVFTYYPDGQIESVTGPAPSPGAVRPQTRYHYVQRQAYFRNASGAIAASGQPITLLSKTSQCLTMAGAPVSGTPGQGPFVLAGAAACAGTADERVETVDYGPQQSGVANNLWPVGRTVQSGDGLLVSSVGYSYDRVGNLVAEDGPLPGSADTTVYIYDAARRLTGMIGPDPDGTAPRKNAALRYVYGNDGQVTRTDIGTVDSQGDLGFGSFVATQQVSVDYDPLGRRTASRSIGTAGVTGVAQYSYDVLDRVDCLAVRMNDLAWNALPTSACAAQTPGSAGPDRITKYAYDNADRPTNVISGYGTTEPVEEITSYADNGQIGSVTDGKGNVTTYGYDGFDRPSTATFPGGSYEQLFYDDNGNVTSRRRRDGTSIAYVYDNLGRTVTKTLPNGEGPASYSYDLLGHPLAVTQGTTLSYEWDALGRMTKATQPYGALAYGYDAAGNRTRTTWSDTFYVDYLYDSAGNLSSITDKAGVAVASFFYDDLGRRTRLERGNGVTTTYDYDAASRLGGLHNDLAGTADDRDLSLTYNPAGQIVTAVRSNDSYAYPNYYNLNRQYTPNALNQYTEAGEVTFDYDARGNLARTGSWNLAYTSENLLKTADGGVAMQYDAAGRLLQSTGSSIGTTRFLYDGDQITAELGTSSNAIQRRYVFGPSDDEPLVEYDAGGNRTYLIADERGSITARSEAAGTAAVKNSYDEYGIPGAKNWGRFQYTGQAWLPELGMLYYKARIYSPTLGRFLQTDPIGYQDGLNWYSYAHNDPINGKDPSGLLSMLVMPVGAIYAQQVLWNSAYLRSFYFDEIVVTAYRNGGFADSGSFSFNQYPDEPLYYGYSDGSTQDSKAKSRDAQDSCGRPITATGPTVPSDPKRKLSFITHLHQGNPTDYNIKNDKAHYPFPGSWDGVDVTKKQIPNYVVSKVGVTVVRPSLVPGEIVIDRLTKGGFTATSMPREALRALTGNATNAYNAKYNPGAKKVNPCR